MATMKRVSRLGVIKAMAYAGNTEQMGVVEIGYDDHNETQLLDLHRALIPQGITCGIHSHSEAVFPYPGGYYVYSYGDELKDLEWSIKIVYDDSVDGLNPYYVDIYLYYIGQDK